MSNLPNFTSYGYQVLRELGYNLAGGRVTYLAHQADTGEDVVIKQFQFATLGSNWSGFNAYRREIEVLQSLNHPGIPNYLDAFETPTGFCMVQEYKKAQNLAVKRSFAPEEIKQIAVAILEILGYLQSRIPPIIHRDIKPENILVDREMNVYLVDFGLARIGGGEVAMSSVALGTLGFMAPEQLYSRRLTEATDLYSLGATLICLVTGIKSTAMDTLIDEDGLIAFQTLVPQLNPRFVQWLETMIQPKTKNRFPNAKTALEKLQSLDIVRLPKVIIDKHNLEFQATKLGERINQTIVVDNPIVQTSLHCQWEVSSHTSDPPHTPQCHPWIAITPIAIQNKIVCRVTVYTGMLMANKIYKRQILLHTNSLPETYTINIKVKTANLPIVKKQLPLTSLGLLLLTSGIIAGSGTIIAAVLASGLMTIIGAGIVAVDDIVFGAAVGVLTASLLGVSMGTIFGGAISAIVAIEVWAVVKAGLGSITRRSPSVREFGNIVACGLVLLTTGLGTSLGIGLKVGWNLGIILAIALTSVPLTTILLYPQIHQHRLIARYRQSESGLIKP